MEFHVLGALRLYVAGQAVEPAGHLQRVLLAVLLSRAGEAVGVDVLTDAMWDGRPDPRAQQRLQGHVHKLRRALDDPARLSFGPAGYRLAVRGGELDAHRFGELVDHATAAGDPARRAELLRQALELWRGSPFDGLDVPLLADEARRLTDRRLTALELLYEAELAAGRHTTAIAELAALVREHPLRERLTWLLMTALHRDGRQAEALDAYRATRATLVEELGLDPGPELRELEQRILGGEPAHTGQGGAHAPVTPAQLPPNVTGFVGRHAELADLDEVLTPGADAPTVVVVAGTAGVGKTALAVRWSHLRRDRYPDGQLYVDLRGYGPAEPVTPEDALAGFLRALGVEGAAIPSELDERSARFRTLVDGRRVVLVLDNARTADQVRPLLPGSASVAVLVTSRDSLAGLVVRDGAHRIGLDRLPRAESVDLLTHLVGDRTGASAEPVGELVELCARLPLALRVAGELVRSRPGHDVARLVSELVDEQHRLDLFDSDDDPHTAVRAVFSWSYQNLAEPVARLFRLCGAHPGRDVDVHAMAAMSATDPRTTRRSLAALVRAHLVEEVHVGRYRMHDLLRAYAVELAAAVDGADAVAATTRLREYYLHTAQLACAHIGGDDRERSPAGGAFATPVFAGYDDALRWLEDERPNLLAAVAPDAPAYTAGLSVRVWRYLDVRGHFDDAVELHSQALRAARAGGDRLAEAHSLRFLGAAYFRMARLADSIAHSEPARRLYRELGDPSGEGAASNNVAAAYYDANRFHDVIALCERAVELLRTTGRPARLASALANLGSVYCSVGDYDASARCLHESLGLAERTGNANVLVYPVHALAYLYCDMGRPAEALGFAERALAIAKDNGNLTIEGETTHNLGRIHRQLGNHEEALRRQHEALEVARATEDGILRAMALVWLGHLHLDAGDPSAARARYEEVLASATARPLEQAYAREGLGDVCAALGDEAGARDCWLLALAACDELGVPRAAAVRAKLARAEATAHLDPA